MASLYPPYFATQVLEHCFFSRGRPRVYVLLRVTESFFLSLPFDHFGCMFSFQIILKSVPHWEISPLGVPIDTDDIDWIRLNILHETQKQRKPHRAYIPHVVAPPLPVHRAPNNSSCCIFTSPSSPGVLPPLLFSRHHLLELFLEPSPLKQFAYYSYIPTRRHRNPYLLSLDRPRLYVNLARVEICSSRVPHKQVSQPCVETLIKNGWVVFGDNCFFSSKSIPKITCAS